MRGNTRVVLNTVATYGRSLIAVALGLFSTRWVLAALGQSDLGLYGVVGSIIVFITFLNSSLSGAEARFFAYSLGCSKRLSEGDGSEDLCRWFNMSIFIHVMLPLSLVLIGYPLGVYAVRHWLIIPADRIDACIWVFRCAVFAAFCTMVSVPFAAIFQAFQYITELSVLSLVETFLRFVCAYALLQIKSDRLVAYSLYMMAISVLYVIVLVVWARAKFKECRIDVRYFVDLRRLREFFVFASAKMFGALCIILRSQGGCLLINRYFAPAVNAAYSISVQVSGHTATLSQALIGALQPVVAQKAGEQDLRSMKRYAVSTCRIATLLVLVFVVPLSLEIEWVLNIWLVTPPCYTASLCLVMLWSVILNKMSVGYMLAANAYGRKIIVYDSILGIVLLMSLPLTYVLFDSGCGPLAMVVALLITDSLCTVGRVVFCWWQLKMSVAEWFLSVVVPVLFTTLVAGGMGYLPYYFLSPGFARVTLVSACSLVGIFCCGWWIVFSNVERQACKSFVQGFLRKVKGL